MITTLIEPNVGAFSYPYLALGSIGEKQRSQKPLRRPSGRTVPGVSHVQSGMLRTAMLAFQRLDYSVHRPVCRYRLQ